MISNEKTEASHINNEAVDSSQKIINRVKHILAQPITQLLLCSLVALALFLPYINTPPVRDEADYVAAAQG
jgi:hypothetical protein